jgi:uncharacterized membrane protein YraQ (UPF0718 family)
LAKYFDNTGIINMNLTALKESLSFFTFTMVELTILFIGISIFVGLLNTYIPQEKMRRWLSGKKGSGYLAGMTLGGLTPFCSCSTIPVMAGFLRAGAGFGPTMTFLFTSPLVNPIIIPLFFTLLGARVTLVYTVIALGLTLMISFFLDRFGFERYIRKEVAARSEGGCGCTSETGTQIQPGLAAVSQAPDLQGILIAPSLSSGCCAGTAETIKAPGHFSQVVKEAVGQFKKLVPYMVIGVAIGSIIHGYLPADILASMAGEDNPLAVPVASVLGIPLYLRVSTMVPIAASLVAKGMSMGAVVALIIGGAGASLPELAMLKGFFKGPLLAAFIGAVIFTAVTAGFLVNLLV